MVDEGNKVPAANDLPRLTWSLLDLGLNIFVQLGKQLDSHEYAGNLLVTSQHFLGVLQVYL